MIPQPQPAEVMTTPGPRVFYDAPIEDPAACGGCRGLGAHSPRCWTQPGFEWKRLADKAEALGDQIGANDHEAANTAYALAARFRARIKEAAGDG
ncbi:hypothetical protein SEA_SPEEDDEMON_1250 [Gordonia phage SpeedDemon]|nr:hypothetical protein SEA_SPEEDDEMON_1250 [Gordonia phage SpeedDemon]